VNRVIRARDRVARAERDLHEARQGFYSAIRDAVASGSETQTSLAEALGISRQRVAELISMADTGEGLRLAAKGEERTK
jgi:DNA-binding transcriptional regulator LsrR (DeoR family)